MSAYAIPKSYRKLSVSKLSPNFRESVQLVNCPVRNLGRGEILLKVLYVGINACDIVISAGGWSADGGKTPFDVGLEALGVVVAVADDVSDVPLDQPALFWSLTSRRAYGEFLYVPADEVILVPDLKPEYIALLISGLTAAIVLDQAARVKNGEKVLVTACCGGMGHLALQWAKKVKGCKVIGLVSNDDKVQIVEGDLEADLVINYKTEDLGQLLTEEHPLGIDVILESIGTDLFTTLARHVAPRGRLVSLGAISTYACPAEHHEVKLPKDFHTQGRKIMAFSLAKHKRYYDDYIKQLFDLYQRDVIKVIIDLGHNTPEGPFEGLHGVVRAVEWLHSGKSVGKVIAQVHTDNG